MLTKHQTQLVIVTVLNGLKDKHSHMFLPLLLMKDNGSKALLKLGRLQPKMVTSTSKHLLTRQMKRTNMNATSSKLRKSATLNGIIAHGNARLLQIQEVDSDSTVTLLQKPHQRYQMLRRKQREKRK